MDVTKTALSGVYVLTPRRFGDARGYFEETWNRSRMEDAGFPIDFVQDNQSLSAPVGTLRGLHYQSPPRAQDKLVRVLQGAILDVAVDARVGSPDYGSWISVELSAENARQILVPKGFLHGFVTLQPDSVVAYKCSDFYAPDHDGSVDFASASLGIDWGIALEDAVLSGKDEDAPDWDDWDSPFTYGSMS